MCALPLASGKLEFFSRTLGIQGRCSRQKNPTGLQVRGGSAPHDFSRE